MRCWIVYERSQQKRPLNNESGLATHPKGLRWSSYTPRAAEQSLLKPAHVVFLKTWYVFATLEVAINFPGHLFDIALRLRMGLYPLQRGCKRTGSAGVRSGAPTWGKQDGTHMGPTGQQVVYGEGGEPSGTMTSQRCWSSGSTQREVEHMKELSERSHLGESQEMTAAGDTTPR